MFAVTNDTLTDTFRAFTRRYEEVGPSPPSWKPQLVWVLRVITCVCL